MKRIAFLTSDMTDYGGTQTVVSRLSDAFVDRFGHKVYIFTISNKNGEIKYNLNSDIEIINLDVDFRLIHYFSLIRKVNNLINIHKIDTILGIGCYLNVFLPFLFKVKKIACEHNSYDITSRKTKFVRFATYRFVDWIVSSTDEDVPHYLAINKNSISIHNPVLFSENPDSDEKQNLVITAGSLTPRKGIDRLLKVWKMVEEGNKDVKLEIYGEGEEKGNLLDLKENLNLKNVSFLGNTQFLSEKLSKSKLFVFTSRKEGFPMVLLEAMNYSVPVISFDIKTGPKEIIRDGEDGYLIKDEDLSDMAGKILKLLSDRILLDQMSRNAKKNVERFYINNILNKWEVIL